MSGGGARNRAGSPCGTGSLARPTPTRRWPVRKSGWKPARWRRARSKPLQRAPAALFRDTIKQVYTECRVAALSRYASACSSTRPRRRGSPGNCSMTPSRRSSWRWGRPWCAVRDRRGHAAAHGQPAPAGAGGHRRARGCAQVGGRARDRRHRAGAGRPDRAAPRRRGPRRPHHPVRASGRAAVPLPTPAGRSISCTSSVTGIRPYTQRPVLLFEKDGERPGGGLDPVDVEALLDVVRPYDLKLVFLNACRTLARSADDTASSFAPPLLESGIPAVIGMELAVEDRAAAPFSREFDKALAANQPVDVARPMPGGSCGSEPRWRKADARSPPATCVRRQGTS